MGNQNNSFNTRIFLGYLLIIVGGLYLLSTLDLINLNIPHIIFSFPFILAAIGFIITINSRNKSLGILLFVIGVFFLLPRIFPGIEYNSDIVFPVIIIAFGIYILIKRSINWNYYRDRFNKKLTKDYLEDTSVFGGGAKVIKSDNFKGGNITAIFGGSEIDLSKCKLAEGENVIDVLMIFGGATILVPIDWDVRINVTPLFGGFSHKSRRDTSIPIDSTRTLVIKGVAIFGGGEVKEVRY